MHRAANLVFPQTPYDFCPQTNEPVFEKILDLKQPLAQSHPYLRSRGLMTQCQPYEVAALEAILCAPWRSFRRGRSVSKMIHPGEIASVGVASCIDSDERAHTVQWRACIVECY